MKYYIKIDDEYLYNPQAYLNPGVNEKCYWSDCWTSHPTIYKSPYYTSLKNIRKLKLCIKYHIKTNIIIKICAKI